MGRIGPRGERRKLAEEQHCAANVAQAWVIQQRLLWRPTMRSEGPRLLRRDGREGRRGARGRRGGDWE